jgi:tRNA threonylcarbamoyladenosine biosynthesis protein TsaB
VKILAVDTALGALSAALVVDGAALAHDWREMARGHAEALAPMVEAVMRQGETAFASLDRLAVTTGPGTFTGQRVGLAFMRALALASKKPLIGVTTLDAMAQDALTRDAGAAWAVAASDAKRGEVYLGARNRGGSIVAPMLVPLEETATRIAALASDQGRTVLLAGTATALLMPLLLAQGLQPIDSGVRQPDARAVARLAINAALGPTPSPLYLRAPDAKLPGSPA